MNMNFDSHVEVDKKKALNAVLAVQAAFILSFFISACCCAKDANAGFNVVITALMYLGYLFYSLYIVNRKKRVDGADQGGAIRPMAGGVLIGVTTMFVFLSLMTAIYWGQYAGCESGISISGYNCINKSAMRSVAAFASLLFICELFELAALIRWKDDLFETELGYDDYDVGGAADPNAYAYDGAHMGGTQADL